jgi:hypothetical protein
MIRIRGWKGFNIKKDNGLVEIKGRGKDMIFHKYDKELNDDGINKKIKEKIIKEGRG